MSSIITFANLVQKDGDLLPVGCNGCSRPFMRIMMSDDLIFMLHLDCTMELLMNFTGIISDPEHSEEDF